MLVKITAPIGEAVSVERAKERLRIEDDSNDADLEILIEAATEAVEKETGLTLRQTGFEYRLDDWPCCPWPGPGYRIPLPASPIRSVDAVAYLDDDLVEQTVADADYYFELTDEGADLWFVDGFDRPSLGVKANALRIRFTAGFDAPNESGSGDDPMLTFPRQAEMAILFLVGHWFENREAVAAAERHQVPDTFKFLASQLRIYR